MASLISVVKDGPNSRARLVEDVFERFINARIEFIRQIERCALKGWPDRQDAIWSNVHLQKLFYDRLLRRLKYLVQRSGVDASAWTDYTNTENVHVRVQSGWSADEDQALRTFDSAYAQLQTEIARVEATTDPPALDGPFAMAKHDPELHSAWSKLNDTVLALDRELSLDSSPK